MTDFEGPRLHRDDPLTAALRRTYAAPDDPAYWDGLARRIVARAATAQEVWWDVPRPLLRMGLAAAAVALLVAGALVVRHQAVEATLALEAVEEIPLEQATIATRPTDDPRDASLRYILGR